MLQFLNGAINGTNNNTFMLLSGHDGNIASILGILGILEADFIMANFNSSVANASAPLPYPLSYWPRFASTFIVELYNKTTNPTVRILYNGEPITFTEQMLHCNGEVYCGFSNFEALMMNALGNYTTDQINQECGYNGENGENPGNVGPSSSVNSFLLVAVILLTVLLGLAIGKNIMDRQKFEEKLIKFNSLSQNAL